MNIAGREIGPGQPCLVIAEASVNHCQDLSLAKELIHAAKEAGADMVKFQTYRPDFFCTEDETERWELYSKAMLPWDMHAALFEYAAEVGIPLFSTPGAIEAVDFLEQFDPPAYKISSTSCTNLALIRRVVETGKPVIVSTGAASANELRPAWDICGSENCAMLICTAAYPAPYRDAQLRKLQHWCTPNHWGGLIAGLSDHTQGIHIPIAAVALGANIIEKHMQLFPSEYTARGFGQPLDFGWSIDDMDFADMVRCIRDVEASLGEVKYGPTESEQAVLWLKERLRSE